MKITLETVHGKYSVETNEEFVTLDDVIDNLIKPVLLSAGWHPDNINDIFNIGDIE